MSRRFILGISLALLALVSSSAVVWALKTSPTEILARPDQFDGKLVTIAGIVMKVQSRVSKKGNLYHTFELNDGRHAITIFSFGAPQCDEGVPATVEGRFQKIKREGPYTFRDQVDATTVVCH